MNALAQLLRYYNGNLDSFHAHARFYGSAGVCHLSPQVCLLARPVDPAWPDNLIIGLHPLAHSYHLTHAPEAVHVHIAAGSLEAVRRLLVFHFGCVRLVTYQRKGGPLHRFPAAKLQRLTHRHGIRPTKAPQARPTDPDPEGEEEGIPILEPQPKGFRYL